MDGWMDIKCLFKNILLTCIFHLMKKPRACVCVSFTERVCVSTHEDVDGEEPGLCSGQIEI